MIRFIDLRGQIYMDVEDPPEEQTTVFAFYDTIRSRFVLLEPEGQQCWESWAEFAEDYAGGSGFNCSIWTLERFRALAPDWATKGKP